MRTAIATLTALVVALASGTALADEPRAHWTADEQPHAGVEFELDLQVDGFDQSPPPSQPALVIPGAKVRALGVQPTGMASFQITINGRRQDYGGGITWAVRYAVTVAKEGTIHIPAVTLAQGSKRATAPAVDTEVDSIPTTDAMKLELDLPARPVFVGENIPVTLTWLFRADPQQNPKFQVPMLDGDSFTIGTPPVTNQRTYKFQGGDKELDLPFTVDDTDVDGVQYHRLRATFYAAPKKTGKLEVLPASVVVALPVGRPDFFGNAPSRLFRATDVEHTLEVKPLPETDRPADFAGAVGAQFSLAVTASRSVVQLGEPVDLTITVKSDQRLDTLALPRLDGPGELPKDRFSVPADPPTGVLSDDGKTKTFKVTAQLTGPATEIPALAFSYFDPVKGTYQTVHSDPIALSVKGGAVVGAADVVAAAPSKPGPAQPQAGDVDLAQVPANLALSAPGDSGNRPLGGSLLWLILGLLYLVPVAIYIARRWQLRTRSQRVEAAEVRAARRRVEQELARAAKEPARDTAGALASALRALARALEITDDQGLLARLETESFAPGAASSPVSAELRAGAEHLVRDWTRAARRARKGKPAAAAAVLLLACLLPAHAARAATALDAARLDYQDALAETDASARHAKLGSVEHAFEDAARAHPDEPELLADWGTVALAAGDVATATLAYRRVLLLDGDNARARKNLAWLRSRQPEALRPPAASATEALLFFHRWPRARRLVVGALAFAIAVLLVVPWTARRRRGLAALAVVPLAIWLAMLGSVVFEDTHRSDAIVMTSTVLRAADSAGAPAAMAQPLPGGAEVTVLERRDAWTRVRLASGASGWVESGAVEQVRPR